MINLGTGDSIIAKLGEAKTTTDPTYDVNFMDSDDTAGNKKGSLNGTSEVEICTAPVSDERIAFLGILYNADTVTHTFIVYVANGADRYIVQEKEVLAGGLCYFGPGEASDAGIPSTYLDTDGTLAANSDAKVATQKATKTYADTKIATSLFDAQTVLAATADNTPAALTVTEQTVVGRLTGGNVAAVSLGIADNNILQIDDADAADNDFVKLTTAGAEGRSATEVRSDLGTEPFVCGADADGDIWYRASGALARLAKGTATYVLTMNAGATAPEWAEASDGGASIIETQVFL